MLHNSSAKENFEHICFESIQCGELCKVGHFQVLMQILFKFPKNNTRLLQTIIELLHIHSNSNVYVDIISKFQDLLQVVIRTIQHLFKSKTVYICIICYICIQIIRVDCLQVYKIPNPKFYSSKICKVPSLMLQSPKLFPSLLSSSKAFQRRGHPASSSSSCLNHLTIVIISPHETKRNRVRSININETKARKYQKYYVLVEDSSLGG